MKNSLLILVILLPLQLSAQQVADTSYNPPVTNPEYTTGIGPVVFIDEGHYNFHTKDGRYLAFAKLLERDGYVVRSYSGEFNKGKLARGNVLVIANALNKINEEAWYEPILPAFSEKETKVVEKWVKAGGSLFLIADHMPFGGAAKNLAAKFGFELTDGYAIDTTKKGLDIFSLQNGTLKECVFTNGRNSDEKIDKIVSFTGQAFMIPPDAISVMEFSRNYISIKPDSAGRSSLKNSKITNVGGWYQGAYKSYGKGKVAVFGEAAMFSAQLAGPLKRQMGMNNNEKQNYRFLLNIIHWLDE